jgi:hypothetical protein
LQCEAPVPYTLVTRVVTGSPLDAADRAGPDALVADAIGHRCQSRPVRSAPASTATGTWMTTCGRPSWACSPRGNLRGPSSCLSPNRARLSHMSKQHRSSPNPAVAQARWGGGRTGCVSCLVAGGSGSGTCTPLGSVQRSLRPRACAAATEFRAPAGSRAASIPRSTPGSARPAECCRRLGLGSLM